MPGDVVHRFAFGHHAVMAVAADGQGVLLWRHAEILRLGADIVLHRLQERRQGGDQQRIAGAADRDRAMPDLLHCLQLHRIGVGLFPAHAADLHRPVGQRIEPAIAGVQHAAGFVMMDRAGILVQGVVGDRHRRAAPDRVGRLALHPIVAHRHQQAIMPLGDRRRRAAFQHLAGIPGRRRRQLRAHRHGGERRGIGTAPAQHHLRALVQRAHIGFGAHHADDAVRPVHRIGVQRLHPAQRA